MNKDVRKLISEAFNEIYQEIASSTELNKTQKERAEEIVSNAIALGSNSKLNHANPQNEKQQEIFNYAIDRLIDEYNKKGPNKENPNIKSAIQSAFYPVKGTPLNWRLNKSLFGEPENIQDAILDAYVKNFIENFDEIVKKYKTGSGRFGGYVFNILNKRAIIALKGYTATGGGTNDMIGGGMSTSMDAPIGSKDLSIIDTLQAPKDDTEMSAKFASKEADERKKMLVDMVSWLKENAPIMQYIAFMERIKGSTPDEIAKQYPDIFPGTNSMEPKKRVSKALSDLKKSRGLQVAKYISNKYNIPFNFEDINWKELRQIISQDYSFIGEKGIRKRIDTPEIKNAKEELSDIFAELNPNQRTALGIKDSNDFSSSKKVNKIIQRMMSLGMEDIAPNVKRALDKIKDAKKKEGGYSKNVRYVDDENNSDDSYGGMFEGVDIDKLVKRIYKRLHK